MKHPIENQDDLDALTYDARGLIPVIAQDEVTGAVLMMAYASREALTKSLETQRMTYWSRERNALWSKGETSGHTQRVVSLSADCDRDTVLAIVNQRGPACHENTGTCWSEGNRLPVASVLGALDRLARDRIERPAKGYTDTLLADPMLMATKILEEAHEVAIVLRKEDNEDTLEHEAADLMYHLIVALRGTGSELSSVLDELRGRFRPRA